MTFIHLHTKYFSISFAGIILKSPFVLVEDILIFVIMVKDFLSFFTHFLEEGIIFVFAFYLRFMFLWETEVNIKVTGV